MPTVPHDGNFKNLFLDFPEESLDWLLPQAPEERHEAMRRAYAGLYRLASAVLFGKYVDFIDLYARVDPTERENLYREFSEKEDTAMLAQYIKDKGRKAFFDSAKCQKTGAPGRNADYNGFGGGCLKPPMDADVSRFWSQFS